MNKMVSLNPILKTMNTNYRVCWYTPGLHKEGIIILLYVIVMPINRVLLRLAPALLRARVQALAFLWTVPLVRPRQVMSVVGVVPTPTPTVATMPPPPMRTTKTWVPQ